MNKFLVKIMSLLGFFVLAFIACLVFTGYPQQGNILGDIAIFIFYSIGLPAIIVSCQFLILQRMQWYMYIPPIILSFLIGCIISIPYVFFHTLTQTVNNPDAHLHYIWGSMFLFPFVIIPFSIPIYFMGKYAHARIWKNKKLPDRLEFFQKRYVKGFFIYLVLNLMLIFGKPPVFILDLMADGIAYFQMEEGARGSLMLVEKKYILSEKRDWLLRPRYDKYDYRYQYVSGYGIHKENKVIVFTITAYGYPYEIRSFNL